MAFHETRFPTGISLGSRGGPRRKTIIATSGTGYEARNAQWADSRREYNAGYGIKSLDDLHRVTEFFEERLGRLHGFRWKDKLDWKSIHPSGTVAFDDQTIGTGDGVDTTFQLSKVYGSTINPYTRNITKPVLGTVLVGINGTEQTTGWTVDTVTGIVTFSVAPPDTHPITAGFEFDVPVRFDTDFLEIDHAAFDAGVMTDIPILEVRI